jgi:glutamate dehydrogenase
VAAFDARYRADTVPETALRDVESLEGLERAPFVINLLNLHDPAHASQQGLGREASHLEVYHLGRTLVLSDVLPLLENLGLRVLEQVSYTFEPHGAPTCGLDIFRVQDGDGEPLQVGRDGDRLRAALLALLQGEAENDRLGRLVLYAGLTTRQVALLRALQMYTAQLRPSVSRAFIRDTLLKHPGLAARLVGLFELKFAPGVAEREAKLEAAEAAFEEGLQAVSSLAEDETLRGLGNLVDAAVRTNYFLNKPYISLKLESARVTTMPEPRPLFEIAVSSPHVEGTHLRGGRVRARRAALERPPR